MPSVRVGYVWYALVTFLSAFLLFSIQPIVSKVILPWFGGAASVWAVGLIFFTGTLFLGYAYVYLITRLSLQRQAYIHLGVIVVAAALTAFLVAFDYPLFTSMVAGHDAGESALRVLGALAVLVGAPFFLLSTSAPLLQYWHGTGSGTEPYSLYALSNTGSLLALISYPFVIEPFVPLSIERSIWMFLFFLYALLAAAIAYIHLGKRHTAEMQQERPRATLFARAQWVLYPALPSLLLVSSTTILTQALTSVPLLWVVPLALYLLTYIIAFSGRGTSIFVPFFVVVAAYLVLMYTPSTAYDVTAQTIAYMTFLFLGSLFCHAYLYRIRPDTPLLPTYYLYISFGGVLGTFLGSFVAPFVFMGFFWEFPASVAAVTILAVLALSVEIFPRFMTERHIRLTKYLFACLAVSLLTVSMTSGISEDPTLRSRNFYGPVEVQFSAESTSLMHGTTLHGLQLSDPAWSHQPVIYYAVPSGVGRAMAFMRSHLAGNPARVAIVGLGTGSMTSYCEKGDSFVFYEIDSRIHDLAQKYFSYLSACDGVEVRIGDGRKLLEQEIAGGTQDRYDLIVIDAFSDDSIPVHLLTKEALETYLARLTPETGMLAIHTSNRYLALSPILLRISRELNLNTMMFYYGGDKEQFSTASQWVLLTYDLDAFAEAAFEGAEMTSSMENEPPLWTDDYTSIFSVLNLSL